MGRGDEKNFGPPSMPLYVNLLTLDKKLDPEGKEGGGGGVMYYS